MRKSASYNEPDGDVLGDKYRQTRSIIDPLRKKLQTSIMAALDRCNIRDDRVTDAMLPCSTLCQKSSTTTGLMIIKSPFTATTL